VNQRIPKNLGRQRTTRHRLAPPGVSLLEVVLAVVMLGLVAASLTGALSAIENMSSRNKKMLAAYEIANRLILTYLDNPQNMPNGSLPLDYGPYQFMWDSDLGSIEMKINDTQKRTSGAAPQALDRFEVITITIYDAEGEGPQPRAGDEMAVLSRMYDPAAPRNPESMKNIVEGANLEKLISKLGGGASVPLNPNRKSKSGTSSFGSGSK
jgi:hypothetical protein